MLGCEEAARQVPLRVRVPLVNARIAPWGLFVALGLLVADVALPPRGFPLLAVSVVLVLACARASPKALGILAGLAILLEGAARIHLRLEENTWRQRAEGRIAARLGALEERKRSLVGLLQSASDQVAALPEVSSALRGNRAALTPLFLALESLHGRLPQRPALCLHASSFDPIAWSGRLVDPETLRAFAREERDVFALEGSVSTTLVAILPLRGAGELPAGFVSATLPVAVRRNIRNEYLKDFDLFTGLDPRIEIQYVDVRSRRGGPEPFPPLDPALVGHEAFLKAPDGDALAAVRVTLPGLPQPQQEEFDALYRRALSFLAAAWIVIWGARAPFPTARVRLLVASTALRASLLYLGSPIPAPGSALVSAGIYASTLLPGLMKSPLDLLLSSLWLLVVASLVFERALRVAPSRPSAVRAILASLLALPLLVGTFALLSDTVTNSSLDLATIPLLPRTPSALAIQIALCALVATGACGLTTVFVVAGPLPGTARGRLLRLALWLTMGWGVHQIWPQLGLPLIPALGLFALSAFLGGTAQEWWPRVRAASLGERAGWFILAAALTCVFLYPSLVHFSERNTRLQIEGELAPLVRQQPQWRAYILAETQRRIDALKVLEEPLPGPRSQGVEELAFAVWAATDLAAQGVSSAVEIQDASGLVISRFALDLPSLAGRPLPASEHWKVSTEGVTLASAERRVLHARKLLVYHGQVHGAIHVYVADDFWNLPILRGRDPYSVLYRTGSRRETPERPVVLLAYDPTTRDLLFSSASNPPLLTPHLLARVGSGDLWTTLRIDEATHHAYLSSAPGALYGLAYPRLTPGRFLADLVEALAAVTLTAVGVVLLIVALRSLVGLHDLSFGALIAGVSARFTLRLLVAFLTVAALPVAVLELVVRGFVADRLRQAFEEQAVERASFARKIVEDYVYYQRGESNAKPIGDEQLVWVASVIRNDLEVFQKDRLLATSKRELYDSGLLAPRISGALYSALVLESKPFVLQPERIGEFSYLVVSVPVRTGASEPGILSIPLALRQREVEAAVGDLDRTMRLASVLFVGLAAVLAHSMARRISGPISALTEATRKIAHGDLTARVDVTSRDELMRLVQSFNQMADDLDRQRRDLERSNRLAAWGEMARQVAHEVKNPLTPIQLSAEHLRRAYQDGDREFGNVLEACTQTILKQVRTLRAMVTEFSAFARPPGALLQPCDPVALVTGVLKPYEAVLPPGVELSIEAREPMAVVRADRRLLERAVVNLMENALQAVGESGRIRVRIGSGNNGRVEVEVWDSGPGLDPEIRDRVFEPFFSTKTSGSGLGLALVKKIAEDHGGGVALEGEPGEGTRALLWLPASIQDREP